MLLEDVGCDGEYVYASAPYADVPSLIALRLDGEDRHEMTETGEIGRIAVAGNHVFAIAKGGRLVRIDKATGATTSLAEKLASPWGLAIDDRYVYASLLGSYPSYADGGVVRVPREGGGVEPLVEGKSVSAIAVAESLFFASEHQIWRLDPGGAPRALAHARNPHAIVVAGDLAIWTEFDTNGALASVNKHGGKRRDLADHPYTSGIAVVGPWLYWSRSSTKKSAALWRMPIGGGDPEPLARFSAKVPHLAANERVLCVIGHGDGGVHLLDL
jgi:hypothetical protein